MRGNSLLLTRTRIRVVPERARKLAAENFDINDEDDSEWPHNLRISRANTPHLEKVYSNLRQQLKRKPEDKMEVLDVKNVNMENVCDCDPTSKPQFILVINDYLYDFPPTKNQPQRTVKQLFAVTSKLGQGTDRNPRKIFGRLATRFLEKDDSVDRPSSSTFNFESPCVSPIQSCAWEESVQTYCQKEISHVMSGTVFFICLTSAISAYFAALRISA